MRKIATRNFLITAMTILICIVIFCSLLLAQLYQYSVNEKFQSLESDGHSLTGLAYTWKTASYRMDTNVLQSTLASLATLNNTRIMITDARGSIEMYADPYESGLDCGALSAGVMSAIREKSVYKEIGTLSGYYQHQLLSVALPVTDAAGNFRGAVVISAPTSSIIQLFRGFMRGVLVITLFVMLIAAALIYFVSQRTTRPLKEMADASKRFAMGDFSARVSVVGSDEIANLAQSFNYMAESMEKLEKLRSEFIANVSHELKTPMTTIGGFVDGIMDGTIPSDRAPHYLEIVSSEIHRLSRLVSKLLLATRLQAGIQDLNITTLDISSLVSAAVINSEQAIEAKHLNVEINLPETRCFVRGDEDALTQVVTNLVDNAVKYSNDGGDLSVQITEHSDKVYVSVYNTGRGISKEQLPFIFDRFYKADPSRGMDKSSTGLGLYIVKSILKNLHQEITAESEYGRWARFTFTLEPAKRPGKTLPPKASQ